MANDSAIDLLTLHKYIEVLTTFHLKNSFNMYSKYFKPDLLLNILSLLTLSAIVKKSISKFLTNLILRSTCLFIIIIY